MTGVQTPLSLWAPWAGCVFRRCPLLVLSFQRDRDIGNVGSIFLHLLSQDDRDIWFGSPTWIRTTIHGSKGRCPTIRRSGNSRGRSAAFSLAGTEHPNTQAWVLSAVWGCSIWIAFHIEFFVYTGVNGGSWAQSTMLPAVRGDA
jgi:hypothetical protein